MTMTNRYRGILFLLILLLTSSCSNNLPQVSQLVWELFVIAPDSQGGGYEELSLYLQVSDEEGIEDIEEIFIINDEHLLYWKLNQENWSRREIDGDTWLGSSSLRHVGGFPRDSYRYLVIDKTGDRVEGEFVLNLRRSGGDKIFPRAEFIGQRIILHGSSEELFLSFFSGDGVGLELLKLSPGSYSLDEIFGESLPEGGDRFYLIQKVAQQGYYLKAGPYQRPVSIDEALEP